MEVLVMRRPALRARAMVLMVAEPLAPSMLRRIRWTWVPYRMTGQMSEYDVRCCVCEPIFFPFLWLTLVTVIYSALVK